MSEIECHMIQGNSRKVMRERIAKESQLDLFVNDNFDTRFTFSPGLEESLVLGHLLSKGIIESLEEVSSLEITDSFCKVSTISPTHRDVARTTSFESIKLSALKEIFNDLCNNQRDHTATGAFHGAILREHATGRWFTCEDIDRKNTVNKVIGYCAQNGYLLQDCVLLITGRLTSNVVNKGCNVGIPLIASMTVATERGIEIARESNTTLIGAFSDKQCWVYHEGSVKIDIG
ncbi:hypothetical protein EU527_17450 [Candidatus Thorarchaeota archaeon]|nr:MAG: hypothetical protein EU527_17450 [Candidatus Thorarchaeota archaeon]